MYYSYRKFFQDGISINYFRVEPVNRAEGEAKVKKSKNERWQVGVGGHRGCNRAGGVYCAG